MAPTVQTGISPGKPKLLARKSFAHVPGSWYERLCTYYVYLLRSGSDSGLYIGYSSDLRRRIVQHKRGAALASHTAGRGNLFTTKRT